MMKVSYITAHTPYGKGETFILEELVALKRAGCEFVILPRNPPRRVFNKQAHIVLPHTVRLPLVNLRMLWVFVCTLLTKKKLGAICAAIIRHSRSMKILLKNLVVIPKSYFCALELQKIGIRHVHAHWGSTTSTMAYVISELTDMPWSFTLHRWDIAENNMLKEKCAAATFVRCISEDGKSEVIGLVGRKLAEKIEIIHMGVQIPKVTKHVYRRAERFTIICPANLRPKKGHRYLIEACRILVDDGVKNFLCRIIGGGPLKNPLASRIQSLSLNDYVKMTDRIPHEKILSLYANRSIDVVVLPSIVDEHGEREGIPVALMEAMSYGIPVISTKTGGIPELLKGQAGVLIEQKDSRALADAIKSLMLDPTRFELIAQNGRDRIKKSFNIENVVPILMASFADTGSSV